MSKIKFNTLDVLYEDLDFDTMLNVDLVKQLCNMSKREFVKFFYLIYKEAGLQTVDGFYVAKQTVSKVINQIKRGY